MTARQSSLLIDESPLQVIPSLAVAIGLNEAIMLQQIHYWQRISPNEQDGRRWVAMSAPDLVDKFPFWSEKTIKRTVAELRERGLLIITKKSSTSWDRANWYAVDYDAMNRLGSASGQNDPMHRDNLTLSIGPNRPDRSGQNDPITIEGKNKNKNKGDEPPFLLPDWVPAELWKDWLEVRTKKKVPNTRRALEIAVGKLQALKADGYEPAKVLESAIEKGWRGIFRPSELSTDRNVTGRPANWWDSDQGMLDMAAKVGVSTKGLTSFQLKAKINEALNRTKH